MGISRLDAVIAFASAVIAYAIGVVTKHDRAVALMALVIFIALEVIARKVMKIA